MSTAGPTTAPSNPNPDAQPTSTSTSSPNNNLKVTCQCGLIKFTLPSPPIALYHCHCRECRHQSASAFGASAIFPADLIFPLSPSLQTNLRLYTRDGSKADSGREVACWFCGQCGARVVHRIRELDGRERDTVSVRGGLIEGLDWEGGVHIFTEGAVVDIPEGVERWPGEPPDYGRK